MSEPPSLPRPPLSPVKVIGGVFSGVVLFFGLILLAVTLLASPNIGETLMLVLVGVMAVGGTAGVFVLLRREDRSFAIGVLIGAACGLLLFGTCVAILTNMSFH